WFEFASTYSYPAAMRVEEIARRGRCAVQWRPFLLKLQPTKAMKSAYGLKIPEPDPELTCVVPGTPYGELMRRYCQPVCLSADLQDLPNRVRILGVDLIAFVY